ncbi:MAG: hypothetical protein H0T60_17855 [Acidobacteria bacterium]|nr:hypothetical protein [Acidobacteriota bacterium]
MGKGISVIVGRAESGDGPVVPIYRALRTLLCSSCGATIGEGALFTRRALAGSGLRVAAQCRECTPFIARDDGGAGRQRSPLLESLFAPEPESESEPEHRQVEHIAESVRKRLGPALRFRTGKRGPDR